MGTSKNISTQLKRTNKFTDRVDMINLGRRIFLTRFVKMFVKHVIVENLQRKIRKSNDYIFGMNIEDQFFLISQMFRHFDHTMKIQSDLFQLRTTNHPKLMSIKVKFPFRKKASCNGFWRIFSFNRMNSFKCFPGSKF